MEKQQIKEIILNELNEFVYNDVNQSGDKLEVIDLSDFENIAINIYKKLQEKKEFNYFVSYKWYSKKGSGFGRGLFQLSRKIDIDLIQEIENDLIKDEKIDKALIINFELL